MNPRLFDIVHVFVPIDPREANPECGNEFLDLFGSAIGGMVLGTLGLEHLSHFVDLQENLGDLQDALLPVPRAQDVAVAVAAYRRNPRPFALGEVPGVMVPVRVPRFQMDVTLSRVYPGLSPTWRTDVPGVQASPASAPTARVRDVPWRRRSVNSFPAPRLRPPFPR